LQRLAHRSASGHAPICQHRHLICFTFDLMNKSSGTISVVSTTKQWGKPPWTIDFCPPSQPLPDKVNVAVIGGGFTGLSAAARLAKLAPPKNVAVFEAEVIGAGSSGHTGGMALAETAAGAMPGLGDVLTGVSGIIREFEIDCDFSLRGVWELGRSGRSRESPIQWRDSGELRVVSELPGGSVDPPARCGPVRPGPLRLTAGREGHGHEKGAPHVTRLREVVHEWLPLGYENDPGDATVVGRGARRRENRLENVPRRWS